jgi:hypothetical protein
MVKIWRYKILDLLVQLIEFKKVCWQELNKIAIVHLFLLGFEDELSKLYFRS